MSLWNDHPFECDSSLSHQSHLAQYPLFPPHHFHSLAPLGRPYNEPFDAPLSSHRPAPPSHHTPSASHRNAHASYNALTQLQSHHIPRAQPSLTHTPSPSPRIPCSPHSQPHEVFVGNLSFFCRESDLYALFSQYADVCNVRITRNAHTQRSLLFGFVALSDRETAREMARLLDGHLFLGRRMR